MVHDIVARQVKAFFDTGIWSELADDPAGAQELARLIRRRRVQVLFSPTTWGEFHGVGARGLGLYGRHTRAVRLIAWDRILRDGLDLLTLEFIRFSGRVLKDELARDSHALDRSLILRDRDVRISNLKDFDFDQKLKTYIDETKARNYDKASKYRKTLLEKPFDQVIETPGATRVQQRLDALSAQEKISPFVLTFRDNCADLETQIKTLDLVMTKRIVDDVTELTTTPAEVWHTPPTQLLRKHAKAFTPAVWKDLEALDESDYLYRNKTHTYVLMYLLANGFGGEQGSFWFDGQAVAYAHDVHLFVTTDARLARALTSEYLAGHLRRYGREPHILHLPTRTKVAESIIEAILGK